MFHSLQTLSVDILEFLLKRRHLKNLKKSAYKFKKNKKFNTIMKNKWLILTLIYWKISSKTCNYFTVEFVLHFLSSLLNNKKDSQNVTTQMDGFKRRVDFKLQLSIHTSLKRFICLKWILKHFPTILHSQFNYHTLLPLMLCIISNRWTVSLLKIKYVNSSFDE